MKCRKFEQTYDLDDFSDESYGSYDDEGYSSDPYADDEVYEKAIAERVANQEFDPRRMSLKPTLKESFKPAMVQNPVKVVSPQPVKQLSYDEYIQQQKDSKYGYLYDMYDYDDDDDEASLRWSTPGMSEAYYRHGGCLMFDAND